MIAVRAQFGFPALSGCLGVWVSCQTAKSPGSSGIYGDHRRNALQAACLLSNAGKAGTLLVVSSSVGLVSGVASFLTIGS